MKKEISSNQSGFKKNFYQIFPKSSTMNKNNLHHNRDMSSDFSLTEKKYGIDILNDNYDQTMKKRPTYVKKDNIYLSEVNKYKKVNTSVNKSYNKDNTLNFLYNNDDISKEYKKNNLYLSNIKTNIQNYLPNINNKKLDNTQSKKKDISFKYIKKTFNLFNKSSDKERISSEPNELKIIKKKSTYDLKDDNKILKKESNLNKSYTFNRNSLMDIVLSKKVTNNQLSKSYIELEIHNSNINNKLIIEHENEFSLLKRNKSKDYRVFSESNSNDLATFDKKYLNNCIKTTSLICSLETNTFNAEISKKLDNSERIQSLSCGKLGIKNLLSDESIKPFLDMKVESIEDLHINFVFLINKSKMIVKKHEGVEVGDIMSTVHILEETDI